MRESQSAALTPNVWVKEGLIMLAEFGEPGVKVDVIAKRLNITRGSFYWHFQDRAAYLDAILQEWLRITRIVQDYAARQDLEPDLQLAFVLLFALQTPIPFSPGGRLDQALDQWASYSPAVAEIVHANHRARLDYIEQQFAGMGRDRPHILAEAFYSHILGYHRLSTRTKAKTIEVGEVVADLFGLRRPRDRFERMYRELVGELEGEAVKLDPIVGVGRRLEA